MPEQEAELEPEMESMPEADAEPEPAPESPEVPVQAPEPPKPAGPPLCIYLNGEALVLPGKADGAPYYLMDLLDRSGIDFTTLNCPVVLRVNEADAPFTQELQNNDQVVIRRGGRRSSLLE